MSEKALRWSGIVLITTVWVSASVFGLYRLAFYASALYEGQAERWNRMLPRLYESGAATATIGIGLHLLRAALFLFSEVFS